MNILLRIPPPEMQLELVVDGDKLSTVGELPPELAARSIMKRIAATAFNAEAVQPQKIVELLILRFPVGPTTGWAAVLWDENEIPLTPTGAPGRFVIRSEHFVIDERASAFLTALRDIANADVSAIAWARRLTGQLVRPFGSREPPRG